MTDDLEDALRERLDGATANVPVSVDEIVHNVVARTPAARRTRLVRRSGVGVALCGLAAFAVVGGIALIGHGGSSRAATAAAGPSTALSSTALPSAQSAQPTPTTSDAVSGSTANQCSGFAVSVVSKAKGQPTPAAALAAWLKTKPDGFNPDAKAWHRVAGTDKYTDGTAHVTVTHVPAPGSGYLVTDGQTCP